MISGFQMHCLLGKPKEMTFTHFRKKRSWQLMRQPQKSVKSKKDSYLR